MISCCSGRSWPGPTSSASSRRPRSSARSPGSTTSCAAPAWSTGCPPPWRWATGHLAGCRRSGCPLRSAAGLSRRPRLGQAGDMLWLALVLAVAGLCAVVGGGLCARDAGPARCSRGARATGCLTLAAGRDPHRHRERDLGADRGVDRAAALGGRAGAADRAIPGRVPGQCAVPDRGGRHRVAAARSQYLAEPADGAGHAVVHPVQRGGRGERVSDRSARGLDHLPAAHLAVVARRDPARDISVLRDRRADRLRAARGTPASSPRSRAGAIPSWRLPVSAPISPTRPRPAIFRGWFSASPSCRSSWSPSTGWCGDRCMDWPSGASALD